MGDGDSLLTQGGAVLAFLGIVMWMLRSALPSMLKQYRDDVFELQRVNRESVAATIAEFRAELRDINTRHDVELARRDKALDRITEVIDRLVDRIAKLEKKMDGGGAK